MDVILSFVSDIDLKEVLDLDEEKFDRIFSRVFDYLYNNDRVRQLSCNPTIFLDQYEQIEVDVYLCDNAKIMELNSEYRSKNEPTDVLSFAMSESESSLSLPFVHLGEIIISVDKVKEQALLNNHSSLTELVILLAHGILHLLCVHHDDDEMYNEVVEIQKEVIVSLKAFWE